MLSGIYYIHEGGTQSKEPPPELNDQAHLHPHKGYPSPPLHRPNTASKRLHRDTKTQE